jgi:hypothetical protein
LSGKIYDLAEPFWLGLKAEHIKSGAEHPRSCVECAVGTCARTYGLLPAITTAWSYFIEKNGDVIRASNPTATRQIITANDHGILAKPQVVQFNAIAPSQRLGDTRVKPKGKKGGTRNPRMATGNRSIAG